MLAHYEGAAQAPDGEWMARLKLVLAAPAIRGEYLKINSEMQEALAEAIAARTGTDLEQDMYPRILAGAVIAAAQVASGGGPPPTRPCRSARCYGERSSSSRRPAPGCRPAGETRKSSRYRPAQAIEAERVRMRASARVNARAGYLKLLTGFLRCLFLQNKPRTTPRHAESRARTGAFHCPVLSPAVRRIADRHGS
jgi:hypothetical protein